MEIYTLAQLNPRIYYFCLLSQDLTSGDRLCVLVSWRVAYALSLLVLVVVLTVRAAHLLPQRLLVLLLVVHVL